MNQDILLVTDSINGKVDPLTCELINFSKKHTNMVPGFVKLVVPGWGLELDAVTISKETGVEVIYLQTGKDQNRNPEMMEKALLEIISEEKSSIISFLHTTRGCHLAASLSVKMAAACITAVQALTNHEGNASYERGVFNGALVSQVIPNSPLTFLTILPGAFSSRPEEEMPGHAAQGKVTIRQASSHRSGMEIIEIKPAGETDTVLDDADVIVAGGRGIGSAETLSLIKDLAAIFPKAAVAGSKPLCDLKWLPYSRQVGATGKSVSPKLYIACGISGALQHITGMKNAQWVVAINRDPKAMIFSHADYGIVEDLKTFIPILIEKFKEKFDRKPG